MKCRICDGSLFAPVVDLGFTPFADDFLRFDALERPEKHYPLKVVICAQCSLVQLTYTASRELLYQNDYPYVSSTTEMGVKHYHAMATKICDRFDLGEGDLSVDIGSNVGVLAGGFQARGLNALGVEPAPKIAAMANERGITTCNEFFSSPLAEELKDSFGPASVITGTNVVAHIDDLHDLAQGIRWLLADDGVFVFEAPYLGCLITNLEYDTIYHEHLSYLSLRPVQQLFAGCDMEVFDVEYVPIHGGTWRYYTGVRGEHATSRHLVELGRQEDELVTRSTFNRFAEDVARHSLELNWLLRSLKAAGKTIAAVSAPAKGMTLLNYCGIGRNILDYVTEKAPLKIGKYTPGGHIPVVNDEALHYDPPDYALLLAWNFADEIMKNLDWFEGDFIIPIPRPRIVTKKERGK